MKKYISKKYKNYNKKTITFRKGISTMKTNKI